MFKTFKNDNVLIENARIAFRNFSGAGGTYNPAGRRTFTILLDQDAADFMKDEGWNVRVLEPKNPEDEPQPILRAFVKYNVPERYRPKVVIVNDHGKTVLDEDSIGILDWADIATVDILLRPYRWEMNGNTGIKAMVAQLYATVIPDALEEKYYDVPDTAQDAIGGCGRCEECDGHCQHG